MKKNCLIPDSNLIWPELLLNLLLLFFQILSIWYILNGIYAYTFLLILVSLIQYFTLKLFNKFTFGENSVCVKNFIFNGSKIFDYETILEAKYIKSIRTDGPFLVLRFKSKTLLMHYHCYYKDKSNYIKVLRHLQRKEVAITFKGFENKEKREIEKEMSR